MALVPLLKSAEFSEVDQHILAVREKAYGKVLNTWPRSATAPGLFAAYLPFLRQVNGPGLMIDAASSTLARFDPHLRAAIALHPHIGM